MGKSKPVSLVFFSVLIMLVLFFLFEKRDKNVDLSEFKKFKTSLYRERDFNYYSKIHRFDKAYLKFETINNSYTYLIDDLYNDKEVSLIIIKNDGAIFFLLDRKGGLFFTDMVEEFVVYDPYLLEGFDDLELKKKLEDNWFYVTKTTAW